MLNLQLITVVSIYCIETFDPKDTQGVEELRISIFYGYPTWIFWQTSLLIFTNQMAFL